MLRHFADLQRSEAEVSELAPISSPFRKACSSSEFDPAIFSISPLHSSRRSQLSSFLYLDGAPAAQDASHSAADKAQSSQCGVMYDCVKSQFGHVATSFRRDHGQLLPEPGRKPPDEPFALQRGPACGCGSVACPEQYYVRWSGDWKVVSDLTREKDMTNWFLYKMPFVFLGFIPGGAITFLPFFGSAVVVP